MLKISTFVKYIFIAVIIGGVAFVQAGTFTPPLPGTVAPDKNVEAPINISSTSQTKIGDLKVNNPSGNAAFWADDINSYGAITAFTNLVSRLKLIVGSSSIPASLTAYVNGNVGAARYCDVTGENCIVPGSVIGPCPIGEVLRGFADTSGAKICVANGGGTAITITQGTGIIDTVSVNNHTLSVDFSTVQKLLSTSCVSPNYVQSINPATGVVTCATPAGGGGGTTISGLADFVPKFNAAGNNIDRTTIFYSTGNYWIGPSPVAPSYRVEVNGNVGASGFFYRSDISLKKNIKTIDNALEKIMSLRGVSFNWKEDNGKDIGVVAQEVEKVFPEVVKTSKQGIKSVEYGNLIAPLIEAVKEQQKEIESLKKEVQVLKNK